MSNFTRPGIYKIESYSHIMLTYMNSQSSNSQPSVDAVIGYHLERASTRTQVFGAKYGIDHESDNRLSGDKIMIFNNGPTGGVIASAHIIGEINNSADDIIAWQWSSIDCRAQVEKWISIHIPTYAGAASADQDIVNMIAIIHASCDFEYIGAVKGDTIKLVGLTNARAISN